MLLERERELSALEGLMAGLSSGSDASGATIVVEGQPGAGKSTLLAEAGRRARRHLRLTTAAFCCGELEQELAWAAVIGLLGPAVADLPEAARERLFSGPAAAAQRLFAGPAPVAPGYADADPDGYGMVHALYMLVGELARQAPLLLLLDDAHWADRPSLQFLVYLQRRLGRLTVGLVVATRPPAIGSEPDLLERLATGPGTEFAQLGTLAADSVTELVHAQGFPQASETFCRACWEVTAGNPFYLHELLRELRDDRVDAGADADPALLARIPPSSVTRSVLVRLGRLRAPHAGDLARAAAVLGDGTALRHAAALAGIEAVAAVAAADALSGAELLQPGEPLRFVHPLVRAAIYADIPAGHRSGLHAEAAAMLEADQAPTALVALHHLHAPLAGDPHTVVVLRRAAALATASGAPQSAIPFLRRALLEPPELAQRAGVLVELAHAESAVGDTAAIGHLTEALEHTADLRQRAELLLWLGWAEHNAGRFDRAADAFQRGLDLELGGDLASELEAGYLMSATLDLARVDDAIRRLQVIEELPPERQDAAHREVLAQLLFRRTAAGAPRAGILELARRLWDGGRLLEIQGPDSQALWHVVGAFSWADAYPEAIEASEAVLAIADERGLALARAQACYARSWPLLWMARIDAAAQDARTAIEIWHGGLERYLPAAIYYLGLCELERGDGPAARAALALAGPPERWQGSGMLPFIQALEGHVHAWAGDPAAAEASQRACGTAIEALHVTSPAVFNWRSYVALALALQGQRDEGLRLTEDELELARKSGAPRPLGVALRAAGICAGGSAGLHRLQESAAVLADSGATLERAKTLTELGAALRRDGKRRAARPYLELALELLDGSGATVARARAATELGAATGRTVRTGPAATGELTASERRVAELAAQGHTNRYIAGTLQISIKGVEWHLHQSYRKLQITGRGQLPDALAG